MKIGFIGLGHMGQPMAMNLLQQGHAVTVFDKQLDACHSLAQAGAAVAASPGEVALGQDVVFTMLQTGEQVHACCLQPDGIFDQIQGTDILYIDSSTVDITASRELHATAQSRGINMLDAPVSGGVAAAKNKALTFMVGGESANFERAKPILLQLGKAAIYAGAAGNGTAAKICNNMVLGVSMIAVSESFNLAEKLGLPAQTLFDICSQASSQCWSLTSYCPAPGILENVPANNDYQPGFAAAMMLKDLRLARKAAADAAVVTSMGNTAESLYAKMVESGGAEKDFSAIINVLNDLGEL